MQCPVDGTTLAMADRQGVEVDYCPQCRGVWLDRGELDKLIEREASAGPATGYGERERERPRYRDDDDDDDRHVGGFGGGHKRKRKGFLSEIFEFGD
jgi:Zn-finger nucleic acid-binding protein